MRNHGANLGHIPSHARHGSVEMDVTGMYAKARLIRYPVGVFTGDPSGEVISELTYLGDSGKKNLFPKTLPTSVNLGPMFKLNKVYTAL